METRELVLYPSYPPPPPTVHQGKKRSCEDAARRQLTARQGEGPPRRPSSIPQTVSAASYQIHFSFSLSLPSHFSTPLYQQSFKNNSSSMIQILKTVYKILPTLAVAHSACLFCPFPLGVLCHDEKDLLLYLPYLHLPLCLWSLVLGTYCSRGFRQPSPSFLPCNIPHSRPGLGQGNDVSMAQL